jgi:peptidoglycan hydrolase CwlO-like protein
MLTADHWVAIIVALTVAIPATIAAIASVRARRDLRTKNAGTTGELIEDSAKTIEVVQAQQHTNAKELVDVHEKVDRIESKVDRINGRVDRVDRQLDKHLSEVGEGSGKLADWIRQKMAEEDG